MVPPNPAPALVHGGFDPSHWPLASPPSMFVPFVQTQHLVQVLRPLLEIAAVSSKGFDWTQSAICIWDRIWSRHFGGPPPTVVLFSPTNHPRHLLLWGHRGIVPPNRPMRAWPVLVHNKTAAVRVVGPLVVWRFVSRSRGGARPPFWFLVRRGICVVPLARLRLVVLAVLAAALTGTGVWCERCDSTNRGGRRDITPENSTGDRLFAPSIICRC